MGMKDVFLIRKYKNKHGEEKTLWDKMGVSFGTNKDGSINFQLFMFPGVQFQIRDRKENNQQEPYEHRDGQDDTLPEELNV